MKKFLIGGTIGFVLFLLIGLFLFFGILAGVGGGANEVVKEIERNENKLTSDANKLKIENIKIKGDYIEGSIKNTLDYEVKTLTIEANFYDKEGAKLDSSIDLVQDLKQNEVWKFKIWAYGHEKDSYKLKLDISDF
jgi:hypothetical protein